MEEYKAILLTELAGDPSAQINDAAVVLSLFALPSVCCKDTTCSLVCWIEPDALSVKAIV